MFPGGGLEMITARSLQALALASFALIGAPLALAQQDLR